MSPRPLPASFGGPSPRGRWTVPCWVPAGTRSFLRPCSVGTSISAPRIASGMVSGTSTSTLSPLGANTGEGSTRVMTYRSPAGPPRRPGSPLPASRTLEPSLTPGGLVTRTRLTARTAPRARAVLDAGRDVAPVARDGAHRAAALARRAGVVDDRPRAAALRARLRD